MSTDEERDEQAVAIEHGALAGCAERGQIERELGEVKRRAERLVDQVADGVLTDAAVKGRLDALEARRVELEALLEAAAGRRRGHDLAPLLELAQNENGPREVAGSAGVAPVMRGVGCGDRI